MRPPVPSALQRVSPKGGALIQGHYIPGNVRVSRTTTLTVDHCQRIVACPPESSRPFRTTRRIHPRTMDKSEIYESIRSISFHCFFSWRQTMSREKVSFSTIYLIS